MSDGETLQALQQENARLKGELERCGEVAAELYKKNSIQYTKSPRFETFVELKHGIAGTVLSALQEGTISRGRAAEALAEIFHGATEINIPPPCEVFPEMEAPGELFTEVRGALEGIMADEHLMRCTWMEANRPQFLAARAALKKARGESK